MRVAVRPFLFALVAGLLLPSISRGQRSADPAVVVHGGVGTGSVLLDFEEDAAINPNCGCPVPEGRIATRASAGGIGVLLPFGPKGSLAGGLGLLARLGFVETPMYWSVRLPDALVLLPGQQTPVNQAVEDRLSFTVRDLGLETLLLFSPFGDLDIGLEIGVGGSVAWRDLVGFRYTHNIVEPANARFVNPERLPSENQGRTLFLARKEDQDLNALAAAVTASILYRIDIDGSVALVPEVSYRRDLVRPFNQSEWESTTVLALLSFRYRR